MFRRVSILALVGLVAFIAVAVAWLDGSPSITSAYTDPVLGVIGAPLNSASDSKPTRNVPGYAQGKRIGSAYTDPILGVIDAPSNSASDSQPTMDTPSLTPLAAPVINIDFEGLAFSTNISGAPTNPASVLTGQFQNVGVLFGKAGET